MITYVLKISIRYNIQRNNIFMDSVLVEVTSWDEIIAYVRQIWWENWTTSSFEFKYKT